jgi:hypothetical protein
MELVHLLKSPFPAGDRERNAFHLAGALISEAGEDPLQRGTVRDAEPGELRARQEAEHTELFHDGEVRIVELEAHRSSFGLNVYGGGSRFRSAAPGSEGFPVAG